jgi:ABC-2 type transport system permease protein
VLKRLRYYARIHVMITSQYLKARMQYRADFIIGVFGGVISNITGILVFVVLFTSIPQLAGWDFNEILFMFSFYLLAGSLLAPFFWGVWWLTGSVRSGDFIIYYFRPLNIMFYFMSSMCDYKAFGVIVGAMSCLVYASIQLKLVWTFGRLILLATTLFSATLVLTALLIISSCAAFWIVDSNPLMGFIMRVRNVAQYPLDIFNRSFQVVFTYLIPLGFASYYPAQLFLRPNEAPLLAYLSPAVGVALFALAYWVWTQGVNRYSGTGT